MNTLWFLVAEIEEAIEAQTESNFLSALFAVPRQSKFLTVSL